MTVLLIYTLCFMSLPFWIYEAVVYTERKKKRKYPKDYTTINKN